MGKNTHPNTPFGKFFDKIGIWHPTVWETLSYVIKNPKEVEANTVAELTTWLTLLKGLVVNIPQSVLDKAGVTKEDIDKQLQAIDEWLNKLA